MPLFGIGVADFEKKSLETSCWVCQEKELKAHIYQHGSFYFGAPVLPKEKEFFIKCGSCGTYSNEKIMERAINLGDFGRVIRKAIPEGKSKDLDETLKTLNSSGGQKAIEKVKEELLRLKNEKTKTRVFHFYTPTIVLLLFVLLLLRLFSL